MVRPDTCIDCGKPSPEIPNGDDTSIFTRASGWRLVLRRGPDGKHLPEWRCGECWTKYRAAGGQVHPAGKAPAK